MMQIDLERFCWGEENETKMMNNEIGGFIFEKIVFERLSMNSQ